MTVGATTSGVSFALDRGGRVSGRLTAAATGDPLANASVFVSRTGGGSNGTTDGLGN